MERLIDVFDNVFDILEPFDFFVRELNIEVVFNYDRDVSHANLVEIKLVSLLKWNKIYFII
jgi:hypothetical protein